MFSATPGARQLGSIDVSFRGETQAVDVYEAPGGAAEVRNIVFEHELFSPLGPGKVYAEVEAEGPFERLPVLRDLAERRSDHRRRGDRGQPNATCSNATHRHAFLSAGCPQRVHIHLQRGHAPAARRA